MAKEHLFYCSWPDNYTLKDHYFGKVNKFFVIRNLKKEDGFAMFRWGKSATRIKKSIEGANQLNKFFENKDNV